MTAPDYNTGFVLTRNWRDADAGVELEFWVSTDAGPHRLVVPGQEVLFFLPAAEAKKASALLQGEFAFRVETLALRDFAMQPVSAFYFRSQRQLLDSGRVLYR